jgi:hypothetical protein
MRIVPEAVTQEGLSVKGEEKTPEGSRIFVNVEASTVTCAMALSQFTPLARMKRFVVSLGTAMRETSVVPKSTGIYWSAIRRTAVPFVVPPSSTVVIVRMPREPEGVAFVQGASEGPRPPITRQRSPVPLASELKAPGSVA